MSQFSQSNQATGPVQGQIQTQVHDQSQPAQTQMQQAAQTGTPATPVGTTPFSLKDWASI